MTPILVPLILGRLSGCNAHVFSLTPLSWNMDLKVMKRTMDSALTALGSYFPPKTHHPGHL